MKTTAFVVAAGLLWWWGSRRALAGDVVIGEGQELPPTRGSWRRTIVTDDGWVTELAWWDPYWGEDGSWRITKRQFNVAAGDLDLRKWYRVHEDGPSWEPP